MADRLGLDFLLLLRAAEFATDLAIFFGSDCLKTFGFKSIASLCFVTSPDHFFFVLIELNRLARITTTHPYSHTALPDRYRSALPWCGDASA
jgi:hypothetical protein